jgi:simple sugar transport system permease protein
MMKQINVKRKIFADTNLNILLSISLITVLSLLGLGSRFYSLANFQSMMFQVSEFGFLAIAMSLAMLTGGIDLSIVANAGLSGVIGVMTLSGKFFPIESMPDWLVIVSAVFLTILTATLGGLLNGVLIAKLTMPPIIATLGTMILYNGIGMAITNGVSVQVEVKSYAKIGIATVGWMPLIFLVLLLTFIVMTLVLKKTLFGLNLYLTGEQRTVARFSGIRVERTLIRAYTLAGFLVGISAVIITSRVNSARMGFGDTYQLQAILVSVLGGIDPAGGSGSIVGVGIGVIVLQFLSSAFTILQFTPYSRRLIWGGLLLVVVMIKYYIAKRNSR